MGNIQSTSSGFQSTARVFKVLHVINQSTARVNQSTAGIIKVLLVSQSTRFRVLETICISNEYIWHFVSPMGYPYDYKRIPREA